MLVAALQSTNQLFHNTKHSANKSEQPDYSVVFQKNESELSEPVGETNCTSRVYAKMPR